MDRAADSSKSLGFRIKRLSRVFWRSLADSRGLRAKWAMCQCIVGGLRTRLGWPASAREVTLRLGNLRMIVDISRYEIIPYWEIWYDGAYVSMPQFRPKEGACVVDVGGNVGFYAIHQASRSGNVQVLVFEPSPSAFRRLSLNMEINNIANAKLINAAVGSHCGTVHFAEVQQSINCHIVEYERHDTLKIPCLTLDAALNQFGVERVDILKIDTEGFEQAVVAGAKNTLSRVERIVLELHGRTDDEERSLDVMLRPAGFHLAERHKNLVYYERFA
jgi:FkbM family methyltransferase